MEFTRDQTSNTGDWYIYAEKILDKSESVNKDFISLF